MIKAQSAIEYLMTYGWMLIAVSVVAGAVVSIYEPVCSESASGFIGQSVAIEDFGVTTENEFQIVVRNNENSEANVTRIILEENGEDVRQIYDPTAIDPGSSEVLSTEGADQETADCTTYDVQIDYDVDPLEDQRATGSLTTSVDFPEIDSPSSPENAELELS